MSDILKWAPEKSRFWNKARVENLQHIRDDLAELAERIKGKADGASVALKADAAKLSELESGIATLRHSLETLYGEARQRLDALDHGFEEERQSRQLLVSQLETSRQHAESAGREAEQARGAAAQAAQTRLQCDELARKLIEQAEAHTRNWEQALRSLSELSAAGERSAREASEFAQAARQALSDCRASAEQHEQLRAAIEAGQKETSERMAAWLADAESHAKNALETGNLAAAAAELASSLKGDCDNLSRAMRARADELTAAWSQARQELSGLSTDGRQNAEQAAKAVQEAAQLAAECRASAQSNQELKTILEAERAKVAQEMSGFEAMLQQTAQQVATSGEHLDACQRLHARVAETETHLKALKQTVEEQAGQAKQSRSEAAYAAQELQAELAALRLNSGSFWGRLKWLLKGQP
jgi:chromosome segregation ATPase